MRPQFGSDPAIAVFTSGELAMVRAIRSAAFSLLAPSTSIVINLRAPSPSAAICFARDSRTLVRATSRAFGLGRTPDAPLAITATVSFVEVSPSTVRRLNVTAIAFLRAVRSSAGVATASVTTNPKVVAMLG
jgi:hypothetical protein